MFNLFKHELTSRWVSILGWGLGLTLWGSMYIASYPSVADQMGGFSQIQFYKALGFDFATFAGYIAGAVVQLMPIVLGIYVITVSTGTIAGEEDNGTLELVVAMPLPRWQIVTMKAAALSVVIFLILVILGIGNALTLLIVSNSVDLVLDTTPMQMFMALLGAYPMLLAYFGIGLFLGAFMPSRRLAVAVLAFIYLASYVLNSIGNLVESMSYFKAVSLFSYFNASTDVFTKGQPIGDVIILLVIALVFFGLAVYTFESRNITVGEWFWQRGKMPAK